MKVIYSKNKVEGITGIYADPLLFNGDTESCDLVYTNNAKIKLAYEAKGIQVIELPKAKTTKKSSLEEK
jgi:hypothetical protein